MQRFTISLEAPLAEAFDELIRSKGYHTRSEAISDLLRQQLGAHQLQRDEAPYCIATLPYIYNHHRRAGRPPLTALQHQHHDLTLSAMHAHLDHHNCIETVFLRGPTTAVREFADALLAERGVRHGQLNLIAADVGHEPHQHLSAADAGTLLPHVHSTPKT